MRRSVLLSLVLSFFALSLFASISIDPAAPTSATPVTLTVVSVATCPPPPVLARSGFVINVATSYGPCLTPPQAVTYKLLLGVLPPGDYEVVVTEDGVRTDEAMFFVSDASSPLLFVLGPDIGSTTGGTRVTLQAGQALTCTGTLTICPLPTVTFNGVPATVDVDAFKQGNLVVTTPPNTKGIAKVVVIGSVQTVSGYVFRYYDPNETPPSSMFERVLLPVYLFGGGAFGSNWTTEVTMLNASGYDIEPYRLARVPHQSQTQLDLGGSRSAGTLVFTPREMSSYVRFGSLVRDTSRQAADWGTEVPVIRENEFRSGEYSLLNIPLDSRFRLTLRVYGVDSVDGSVGIRAVADDGTAAFRPFPLRSPNPCAYATPCASSDPSFLSLDPLAAFPEMAGKQRMRLDIILSIRSWGFVTITNNETQHVTVITPQ